MKMIDKTLLALASSALLIGSALAGPKAALPKDLPPYAADKPLPVPQIGKKKLANGLEVWVVPRDGMPRVDYVLAVRDAGLAADAADAPGFAGLYAGLLSEGTAKRDSRAIAETAQSYGGSVGAGRQQRRRDGVRRRAGQPTPSRCSACSPKSCGNRRSPTTRSSSRRPMRCRHSRPPRRSRPSRRRARSSRRPMATIPTRARSRPRLRSTPSRLPFCARNMRVASTPTMPCW